MIFNERLFFWLNLLSMSKDAKTRHNSIRAAEYIIHSDIFLPLIVFSYIVLNWNIYKIHCSHFFIFHSNIYFSFFFCSIYSSFLSHHFHHHISSSFPVSSLFILSFLLWHPTLSFDSFAKLQRLKTRKKFKFNKTKWRHNNRQKRQKILQEKFSPLCAGF